MEQTLGGIEENNIFSTADDCDISFASDIFEELEGFTGIENTLTRIAWGPHRQNAILEQVIRMKKKLLKFLSPIFD